MNHKTNFLKILGLTKNGAAYPIILISGSNSLAKPSKTIIFYKRVAILPSNLIWHFWAQKIIS